MKGLWEWILHRLTGLALLPLIAFHVWAWHAPGAPRVAFAPVGTRLEAAPALVAAMALLALVIFHGLAGLRNVLADWCSPTRPGEARLTASLWLAGLLLLALGGWGLFVFSRG